MDATIVPKMQKHYPVLLKEIISVISPQHGGTFIDCTLGQGGYSKKILDFKNTKVIAIDRDIESEKIANQLKENFEDRFIFKNIKFSQLSNLKLKNENIRGAIFDLGYSYTQIKDPKKGLSFDASGKLNMQLGLNNCSAEDVINKLDEKKLEKIFKFFGDEKDAKKISQSIIRSRNKKFLDTTDLVEIINKEKKNYNLKINKCTKIFQSLRILVNQEMSELIYGLINAYNLIPVNSYIIVVTFHSIEDKIVKFFFKNYSETKKVSRYLPSSIDTNKIFELLNKKPITPSIEEIKKNPSSRSAKLRCVKKIKDGGTFEEFLLKFRKQK